MIQADRLISAKSVVVKMLACIFGVGWFAVEIVTGALAKTSQLLRKN